MESIQHTSQFYRSFSAGKEVPDYEEDVRECRWRCFARTDESRGSRLEDERRRDDGARGERPADCGGGGIGRGGKGGTSRERRSIDSVDVRTRNPNRHVPPCEFSSYESVETAQI